MGLAGTIGSRTAHRLVENRIARAGAVEAGGLRRIGAVRRVFIVIETADHEIEARQRSHQLDFLAELVLIHPALAVASERAVRTIGHEAAAGIFIGRLLKAAERRDRAQRQRVRHVPAGMDMMPVRLADVEPQGHARAGDADRVRLQRENRRKGGRARQQLAHMGIAVALPVAGNVEAVLNVHRIRRLPQRGHAQALAVDVVPVGLALHRIVDPAVPLRDETIHLDADPGNLRKVHMRLHVVAVEVAHPGRDIRAELARRLARHDAERAAHRVAAEDRALRTAQHLDALDVEHFRAEALRATQINPIHVNTHHRVAADLAGVRRHDAAHADHQGRRAAIGRCHAKRRNRTAHEIMNVGQPPRLQILAAQNGDGNRRVLQVFLTLLRRHHNLVQSDPLCGLRLTLKAVRRSGPGQQARDARRH